MVLADGLIAKEEIMFERGEGYHITTTNRWMKTLTNISVSKYPNRIADLNNMHLRYIEDNAFRFFRHIDFLILSNNKLTLLRKDTFAGLTNLKILDLSNNAINRIENSFDHLSDLKSLDLSHNLLKKLGPKDFFQLMNSCYIELMGNKELIVMDARPNVDYKSSGNTHESLFGAENIVKFCIKDNKLISLEHYIDDYLLESDCYASRYYLGGTLDMAELDITEFKKGWYKLTDAPIRDILLSGNRITRLTREMFNDLPESISSVDLSYNKIERLEKGIIMNQHLREMNFEHNEIIEIEDDVFSNTDLTSLSLSHNNLRNTQFAATLPSTLKEIHLNNNKITEISGKSFLKLKKLTHLYLGKNNITNIHKDSLRGLSNLTFLDLMSNRLKIEAGSFTDQKKQLGIYLDVNDANEFNFNELPDETKIHYVYLGSIKPWKLTAEVYDRLPRGLQIIDLQHNRVYDLLATDVFIRPPEYMYLIWNNDNPISITAIDPPTFIQRGFFMTLLILLLVI